MMKSIENPIDPLDKPGVKEYEFHGYKEIDGIRVPIYKDRNFTSSMDIRSNCRAHIEEGTIDEIENEFTENGVVLPDVVDMKTVIRYKLICEGSCNLGSCAARVVQYDRDGNHISPQ
jgi:hypothetical protein